MKLMKKTLSVVLAVLMLASVCVFSASAAETVTFGGEVVAIDGGKVIVPAKAVYYEAADGSLCFPGDIIEVTAGDAFTAATATVAADNAFSYWQGVDSDESDTFGIRARGAVATADIAAADEIGFVIVPKIAPDLTADFAASQYAHKVAVADKADSYDNAVEVAGKQYQVCLKGLKGDIKSEKFLFAMYVKTGDAYTYSVIGAESHNSIPRAELNGDIEAILAAGAAMAKGTTSGYEVTITGTVASIANTQYGNMNVEDANGNTILVYGTYSSTGAVRFDAMETQPKVGDEVTITGEIKNYNGTVQINNGRLMAHTVNEVEVPKIEGTQAILEAAYALASGEVLSGGVHEYTLTGTIISIDTEYSSQYGNITVTIACEGFETMPIQAYRLKGADEAQTALIGVNDVITVTGTITNYNGTIEFNQGCTFTGWVDNADPEPEVPDIPDVPAGSEVVFEFGDNGDATHSDGNTTAVSAGHSYTSGAYTLTFDTCSRVYKDARDAKGNSCIKLGSSSKAASFTFTVPEEVDSVIILAAKYKSNTSKLEINGTTHTLTKASNNGEYDVIVIDTTTNKTITGATLSGGYRVMINSITFVLGE
ncbi:MAG: hypothetical protein E7525_06100 [Ruminococcaceae bacterium]|nr:hypothetical protein [Oscillospiraceae bacterium]